MTPLRTVPPDPQRFLSSRRALRYLSGQRQTRHRRDALAGSALDLPADAHRAYRSRARRTLRTNAFPHRAPAIGAQAPDSRGVDDSCGHPREGLHRFREARCAPNGLRPGARRGPWWVPWTRRATPRHAVRRATRTEESMRWDRADFARCFVARRSCTCSTPRSSLRASGKIRHGRARETCADLPYTPVRVNMPALCRFGRRKRWV